MPPLGDLPPLFVLLLSVVDEDLLKGRGEGLSSVALEAGFFFSTSGLEFLEEMEDGDLDLGLTLEGDLEDELEGDLEGGLDGDLEGDLDLCFCCGGVCSR